MIEFKNVTKRFGTREVLKNLSFSVAEGEILFILGTSGTGKSVALKTIVGLLRSDGGEVWIDGAKVSELTEAEYFPVRKKCGMVFQHPALFDSISVFENIAFGLRKHFKLSEEEISARVKKCLGLVQLSGIETEFPNQISYGMQKRVSFARTIAIEPRILLFDEPTTGLDPITTNAINLLIQELSRKLKITSVVVSHDMKCALEIADRIIFLDKGAVVAHGTPAELRTDNHALVKDFFSEVLENEMIVGKR